MEILRLVIIGYFAAADCSPDGLGIGTYLHVSATQAINTSKPVGSEVMIGRRQNKFFEMIDTLRRIEADKDNIELVKQLNTMLIKEIIRAEQNADKHHAEHKELVLKLKTGRLPKDESNKIRKRIKRVKSYIDGYTNQIYIWRSVGDALAFAYLDKFAMKHVFYDTNGYDIKPHAGRFSGKGG